jgi:hypothetical protein
MPRTPIRHQGAVDPEGRKMHGVRGLFVVVRPGIHGPEREETAGNGYVAARPDLRRPLRRRARKTRKRECLRHRLGVLELVPDDHPHHEPRLEQRIAVVERQFGEEREHGFADLRHIGAGGLRRQDRKPGALAACMSERVVEVVVLRRHCAPPADASQEPEFLEVADVGEIPDERRLERRDLARQLLIRERFQHVLRPPSRVLEAYGEVRR